MVAVEQHDVADRAVVEREVDNGRLLDAARLLHDAVRLGGDVDSEEPLPVRVGEGETVQPLDAGSQVRDEGGLVGDVGVLVALLAKLRRRGRLGADRGLGPLEQHRVGRRGGTADGIDYRHEASSW